MLGSLCLSPSDNEHARAHPSPQRLRRLWLPAHFLKNTASVRSHARHFGQRSCSSRVSSSIDNPSTQRDTLKILHLDSECDTSAPWWSQSGSNRRPPACKAGALPAELWPLESRSNNVNALVGLDGLEPSASPLSGVRSNHLSYRPSAAECARQSPLIRNHRGRALPDPPSTCACAPARPSRYHSCLVWALESDKSADSKGGDPAAPSDTATLLRLHPSH